MHVIGLAMLLLVTGCPASRTPDPCPLGLCRSDAGDGGPPDTAGEAAAD